MNQRSLIAVIVVAIVFVAYFKMKPTPPPPPPLISLQSMASLVSLKVNVSDVIEIDEKTKLPLPWPLPGLPIGATKVLFVMKGHGLLATKLDRLPKTSYITDKTKGTATLILPAPILLSTSVEPVKESKEGSWFYYISQKGVDFFKPQQNAINLAMKMAEIRIKQACETPEVKKAAKANAEQVLTGIFKELGWKLTINWQ